jgi:hypothetical protein
MRRATGSGVFFGIRQTFSPTTLTEKDSRPLMPLCVMTMLKRSVSSNLLAVLDG